jgi:hypothetical protein
VPENCRLSGKLDDHESKTSLCIKGPVSASSPNYHMLFQQRSAPLD